MGFGNLLNVVQAHRIYLPLQIGAIGAGVGLMAAGAATAGAEGIASGLALALIVHGAAVRIAALRAVARLGPEPAT